MQINQVHVLVKNVYICLIKCAVHNNIVWATVILLLVFHVSCMLISICDHVMYVESISHHKESTQDKGSHHKTDSTPAGENV